MFKSCEKHAQVKNWILSPIFGVRIEKIFETKPPVPPKIGQKYIDTNTAMMDWTYSSPFQFGAFGNIYSSKTSSAISGYEMKI